MTVTDPEIRRMAQRIRSAREEAGLTIGELARRADLAASTIQKVETLQMVPSVAVLVKIARGLERSPGDFIRDVAGLGYRFSTDELVELRNHGVNGDYLRKLKESGFQHLSADKIVKLRDNGVE